MVIQDLDVVRAVGLPRRPRFIRNSAKWRCSNSCERRGSGGGDLLSDAQRYFAADFRRMHVVELDEVTCDLAAQIAEVSSQVARALALSVLGA